MTLIGSSYSKANKICGGIEEMHCMAGSEEMHY